MDKVFKIKKNNLVNNFKIACDKLNYKDIEINPVTDSITYKAIGKGLRWGTNAIIKIVFIEKGGYTNASFEILKEIRFPTIGKKKVVDNFYKEIIGLVELLNEQTLKNNQSFNDTESETNTNSLSNKDATKTSVIQHISSSNSKSDSENIKTFLDKNKKQKNKKILIIAVGIFIFFVILVISNLSSINACDCIEAMAKSKSEVYSKCIKQDYDKAFDYWESRDPNRIFENQEAVIQAYWMEKCY